MQPGITSDSTVQETVQEQANTMESAVPDVPVVSEEPADPPVTREPQDKDITELITAVLQLIERVELNEEVAGTLAESGYDADRFEEGRNLCRLVQDTYIRRQVLMSERSSLTDRLHEMDKTLYKDFSDFRVVARALFKDRNDRRKLGVSGRRSTDRQRLLTAITAAAAAALEEPFLEPLSRHGYGAEQLAALREEAEAVRALDNEQDNATILAQEATSIRNEAALQLRQWVSSFRSIAKRVLRATPEWLDILEM